MKLSDLKLNETAVVKKINTSTDIRRRFLDIGLVENTRVKCVGKSPLGDPSAYFIRGAVVAIRDVDASTVLVERGDFI